MYSYSCVMVLCKIKYCCYFMIKSDVENIKDCLNFSINTHKTLLKIKFHISRFFIFFILELQRTSQQVIVALLRIADIVLNYYIMLKQENHFVPNFFNTIITKKKTSVLGDFDIYSFLAVRLGQCENPPNMSVLVYFLFFG